MLIQSKFLAGLIIFESSKISSTVQAFLDGRQALNLPLELGMTPFIVNHPQTGRTMMTTFVWSGEDKEAGKQWLEKIQTLAAVVAHTVTDIDSVTWLQALSAFTPYGVWGGDKTVSIPKFSESTTKIITDHLEQMPFDGATCLCIHELAGASASKTPSSCFGHREPHFMLELIGSTVDLANMKASQTWIAGFHEELRASSEALKGEYVSLSTPGDVPVSDMYADNWEFLLQLKEKHDPEGVFDLAVPRLRET
jgi:hypothetical protein